MLQQTQVKAALPYYNKFLKKWPDLDSFYKASLEEILYQWQGLGYYQRAKNLYLGKEFIKNNKFSIDPNNLKKIPGIGDYISCSIPAILEDQSCTVLDTNIKRIIKRYFGLNEKEKGYKKTVLEIASKLTPQKNNRDYCQSLMDLANIVCKAKSPECKICPIGEKCRTKGHESNKNKKISKIKKRKFGVVFLIEFNSEWLVEHTKEKLLEGLYTFPMTSFFEKEVNILEKKLYENLVLEWKKKHSLEINHRKIDFVNHSFSHFHLKLLIVNIKLNKKVKLKDLQWMKIHKFEKKPVSTLVKKIKKII